MAGAWHPTTRHRTVWWPRPSATAGQSHTTNVRLTRPGPSSCPLAQAADTHGYASSNQPITRTYDGGTTVDKIAKALTGALTAMGTALLAALSDGSVTATEWVIVGLALVAGGGAVWATPNAPADPKS